MIISARVAIKTGMGMFFFTDPIFLQWVVSEYYYVPDTVLGTWMKLALKCSIIANLRVLW